MADVSRLYIGFFLIFVLYSLYDIGLFSDSSKTKQQVASVEITENAAPTLKFLYCYSCGYRKTFEDYVNIIEKKYPGMIVQGSNYDPPGISMKLAKFLGVAKMFFFLAIMLGINPYQLVGTLRPPPAWWTWCTQNKLYAGVMCFCLINTIEGLLMSTGAFEIFLDGVPVWSKLETGRIPQPPELFSIIDSLSSFDKYGVNNYINRT